MFLSLEILLLEIQLGPSFVVPTALSVLSVLQLGISVVPPDMESYVF
jgi:hypothetical protein